MKRGVTALMTALFFFLSGCGTDVDLFLENDSLEAEETGSKEDVEIEEDAKEARETEDAGIYVYICGAVEMPGVYETEAQSRLYELVDLAGGFTEDADECGVNLAQIVQDGEMIRIPTLEESAEGIFDPAAGEGASAADAGSGKVNINTAGAEQLTVLAGIGEVKAAAIVSYREEHGFFQSTEQLMEVSGIGESTYDKIKDDITI